MKAVLQHKKNRGLGLVEVLVSAGIIGMIALGLVGAFHLMLGHALESTQTIKAAYLLTEGAEGVRSVRDRGWASEIDPLSLETDYYPTFSGGQWELGTTATTTDGFERTIVFFEVNRDSAGDIVESGGIPNDGTRFVTVSIEWDAGRATRTRSTSFYLTDFLK